MNRSGAKYKLFAFAMSAVLLLGLQSAGCGEDGDTVYIDDYVPSSDDYYEYYETALSGFALETASGTSYIRVGSWLSLWKYTSLWDKDINMSRLYRNSREVTDFAIPETFEYGGDLYVTVAVGQSAFLKCALKSVEIPESVEVIESSAFAECGNLDEIFLPDSVVEIGDEAFYLCGGLRYLTLSQNLDYIGRSAFACTSRLDGGLVLPESVKYIGEDAFYNSALASVRLPYSIEYIERNAFACPDLTLVVWRDKSYTDKDELNRDLKEAGIAKDDVWK